jgi:hypothetical protein
MADARGSRRRFLGWAAAAGGLAAGLARLARGNANRDAHAPHAGEPLVMPPLYPGPRIGEPGYAQRVATLFTRPDLPTEPSSY